MIKILKILLFYVLIPGLSAIAGAVVTVVSGSAVPGFILTPLLSALICVLFRKKLDLKFGADVDLYASVVITFIFTVLMILDKGMTAGRYVSFMSIPLFPYFLLLLLASLMGLQEGLYISALATYLVSFAVCMILGKQRTGRKHLLIFGLIAALLITDTLLFVNRAEVRYGGHGFEYMNGYSSTDFTDYTVYAENSRLVTPARPAPFMIEDPEEMPVMDGAEACYPFYAAVAKALYKDIDRIELEWMKKEDPRCNGRIVTFTNTVSGFERLVQNYDDPEKYGRRVDMFFGARPSKSQLWFAEESGVELTITPVGREGFVFFVEEDNPVSDLTSGQIRAIYHGDITNWKELGGPDQEITAFQRPANSGSQTMMEYFMGDVSLKEPETYEKVDSMSGVISYVAQYNDEAGAMGYTFRYFLEGLNQEQNVKLLSVDGVYPSVENIRNGSYPLTTDVCLITRKDETNPNVQKVIDYILSDDGQELMEKTGYARVK